MRRAVAWALVVALALVPAALGRGGAGGRSTLRELLADVRWIAFQRARLAHDPGRALRAASAALALAPGDTAGWQRLCAYLGYELASPLAEPDRGLRRGWLDAALACADEGARRAREPARLRRDAALLLLSKALHDPALADAPGEAGAAELLARAAAAFDAAGEPELAARARALADAQPAR